MGKSLRLVIIGLVSLLAGIFCMPFFASIGIPSTTLLAVVLIGAALVIAIVEVAYFLEKL